VVAGARNQRYLQAFRARVPVLPRLLGGNTGDASSTNNLEDFSSKRVPLVSRRRSVPLTGGER